MKIGYARVSTKAQQESLATQRETLETAGCQKVFHDVASGVKAYRPGLTAAIDYLRPDDTLIVTRIDRLGRSMLDALKTLLDLDERGIRVQAQDVGLDTGTAMGKFVVHVNLALAQMEREQMIERTREGIEHARKNGRLPGPKPKLTGHKKAAAIAAVKSGMSMTEVGRLYGVSRWTVQRAVADEKN
jgi:DNA invertase Pin-like site-specific DNA recombinase